MSSNEKVKSVALAVVELRFSEGRQSVRFSTLFQGTLGLLNNTAKVEL